MSIELRPFRRRQTGRRLVKKDEPRRARKRQRDLELALLAIGQFRHQPVLDRRQMDRLNQVLGGMDERVVAARPKERKSAARDATAGEVNVVEHRQAGKKGGDLIGPPQSAADSLLGRKVGHVLAKEADRSRRSAGSRR